jgi:hypothetical protein
MTTKIEKWKPIIGYEGIYEISNFGNLKTVKTKKITNGWEHDKYGHKKIRLYKNRKSKDFYLHRVVATAFLPKVIGKNFVNHIDSNPLNNNATNLEWCTQAENMEHAQLNNRFSTDGRKIINIKTNKIYKSIKQAADELNVKQNTLVWRLRRNSKKCDFKYL